MTGASELRLKETDRIETVTNGLRALGVRMRAREDGFEVRGVPTRPTRRPHVLGGDHRIAMLAAVAGLVSREGVEIEDADAVAISFPASTTFSTPSPDDDCRHRRPRRGRQEHGRPASRRAAWLPLPRYRGDVPRGDMARDATRLASRRWRAAGPARNGEPGHLRRKRTRLHRRNGRDGLDSRSSRSTGRCRSSHAIPRCARSCASGSASSGSTGTS